MHVVRHLLSRRRLAVLICAAALLLKLLVPTGYMIGSDHGRMTIELCSGIEPQSTALTMDGMHVAMPDHGKLNGGKADHGKLEMPCVFSGLSAATLAAVDPVLLAALIAFVMGVGCAGLALPPPYCRSHLRPPLRGPPAYL